MEIDEGIALVTLDEVKEYLQITADTQDSILSDLVNSVCTAANSYTGRHLASQSLTEYYDAKGMLLALNQYPVTTLTSIHDDPNIPPAFGTDVLVPTTDYQVDKLAGLVRRLTLPFYGGIGNAKIVYVAGYVAGSVPADLALAIKKWVALEFILEYKEPSRLGVSSISQGDRTTSYLKDPIPKDVASILNRYRRVGEASWGIS